MPQFDFSTFSSQVFWVFVSFLGLFAFMYWVIVPNIQQIFENRARAVQNNLEEATVANVQADKVEKLYRAYVNEAEQEAKNMLAKHLQEQQLFYKHALEKKERELHKEYVFETETLHQKEQELIRKNTKMAGSLADTFTRKFTQGGEG